MEMLLIGIVLGLTIGFCCRWFDIPLPSPPSLVGALLVVSMTLGFVTTDRILNDKRIVQERKTHD
jgi:XapX domain-containing protein